MKVKIISFFKSPSAVREVNTVQSVLIDAHKEKFNINNERQ